MDVRNLAMVAVAVMLVFAVSSCKVEKPATPQKPAAPAKAPEEKPAPAATAPEGGPAAAPVAKVQTTCPIMGGAIDKAQYVDVDGYRIYACCPACLPKIKADPKAAIAAIRAKGEEPEKLTQ